MNISMTFIQPFTIYIKQRYFMGSENQGAANRTALEIPTRLQWENGHGFCGETSIQACSLYYGNYISQLETRKLAGGQVLLGENAEAAIQKLGYDIQVWDNQNKPKPQYREYLQWIKRMIKQGYPVITCGYAGEQENDEYDHIYLAIGVNSNNIDQYSDEDQLIYMDLFEQNYIVTKFGKIWDTKQMKGNGKDLSFAIPRDLNWGVAIKGNKDPEEQFLPVEIKLNQKSEPNVSMNEQPVQFNYDVEVTQLQDGKKYVLLRYDSYKVLPTKNVVENQASAVTRFTADGSTFTKKDSVMSNKMVFYRCIEEEDLG